MSANDAQPLRAIWSKMEKKKLLALVKSEGHTNIERIAEAFPNKSVAAIKAKINKYIVLAKSLKPGVEDPIDFWIHSFFSVESDPLISKALLFIRLFDDHPSMEEANNIDFASIYEFLHRLTSGHTPSEISPETWKAFEKEINDVTEYVTNTSEREVLTFLSTLINKKEPERDYSRRNHN